jgi:steroid 5-alpha reductase family enzyme
VVLFKQLIINNVYSLWALLWADVAATVVIWLFGLLYKNVSVYDPYWSVFPPVAFLLWAFYTHTWSLPVVLLLVASWYWGWRLTRNWLITFKGLAHEDWRYTQYRSLHPLLFHAINLFGLNLMPTLVVFAAMLPGLKLLDGCCETLLCSVGGCSGIVPTIGWVLAFLVCIAAATIQLIADKQIHDFRASHPGQYCNVGLWKHGRHPNYFGEILFWWGIWMMYAALEAFDGLVLGPIAITVLFLCVSIPLMEKRQLQNKPGYAEYRKHTRMLI